MILNPGSYPRLHKRTAQEAKPLKMVFQLISLKVQPELRAIDVKDLIEYLQKLADNLIIPIYI